MASVFCKKCGAEIEVPEGRRSPFITCPQCKSAVAISASAASPDQPARPASAAPAARPVSPSMSAPSAGGFSDAANSSDSGDVLPELMKANKRVAGQPCAICARIINLGEPIHNCPSCHSINHDACWKQSGGCAAMSCNSMRAPSPSAGSNFAGGHNDLAGSMSTSAAPPQGTVPCRWCKEPIVRGARKCKHCGEYQRDEDRETNNKVSEEEVSLSTTDWIGVLCCPIIAFIQGIIYSAQGNPKGKRLMLYSAIAMFLGALVKGGSR